jgi:hypothetical protein
LLRRRPRFSSIPRGTKAWNQSASAQREISAREAFEAAKKLDTPEAWKRFSRAFERLPR